MLLSVTHTTETKDILALIVTLTNGSQFHITEDYGGALVVSAPVPMVAEQVDKGTVNFEDQGGLGCRNKMS